MSLAYLSILTEQKIMMNINEINKEIDSLYQSGKIDEAETYMKDQLTKATRTRNKNKKK